MPTRNLKIDNLSVLPLRVHGKSDEDSTPILTGRSQKGFGDSSAAVVSENEGITGIKFNEGELTPADIIKIKKIT